MRNTVESVEKRDPGVRRDDDLDFPGGPPRRKTDLRRIQIRARPTAMKRRRFFESENLISDDKSGGTFFPALPAQAKNRRAMQSKPRARPTAMKHRRFFESENLISDDKSGGTFFPALPSELQPHRFSDWPDSNRRPGP
jgi:hypothetical protein